MPHTYAVILAGGYGTRLHPLTASYPKPLLPVAGEPLMGHQLRWLQRHGIRDVVVATSYLAESFAPVLGAGADYGVRLRYTREPSPLGTAGALALAAAEMDTGPEDTLVVLNGDQLTTHDLSAQLQSFAAARARDRAVASVHARDVDDSGPFGLLGLRGERILSFEEKPREARPGSVNAGTYVVGPALLDAVPTGGSGSLERDTFPALLGEGAVLVAHRDQAYGLDVGTPATLVRASRDAVLSRGEQAVVRLDTTIHPRAQVTGGSCVASGVTVAQDAAISGSLVMDGAQIGAGAHVTDSVIGPRAQIGADATVNGSAVGADSRLESQVILPPGSTVDVGEIVTTATHSPTTLAELVESE